MSEAVAVCPECHGEKQISGYGCPGFRPVVLPCLLCKGAGSVDVRVIGWMATGDQMRKDQIERGKTLRVEATDRGISPSELSEMERGAREPVKR